MTEDEKMREAFEKTRPEGAFLARDEQGNYVNQNMEALWRGFQIGAAYVNSPKKDEKTQSPWLPIDDAPLNTPIIIKWPYALPFIGDVWDYSARSDTGADKLVRLRCFDGHIATLPYSPELVYKPLDCLG